MLTQYGSINLAKHFLGIEEWTMPSELWLGLHTGDPGWLASLVDEISTTSMGYDRIEITGLWSAPDSDTGLILLDTVISRGPALLDWGTISHFSINDAEIAGNMLAAEALSESQRILAGDTFQRAPGTLGFRLF